MPPAGGNTDSITENVFRSKSFLWNIQKKSPAVQRQAIFSACQKSPFGLFWQAEAISQNKKQLQIKLHLLYKYVREKYIKCFKIDISEKDQFPLVSTIYNKYIIQIYNKN